MTGSVWEGVEVDRAEGRPVGEGLGRGDQQVVVRAWGSVLEKV